MGINEKLSDALGIEHTPSKEVIIPPEPKTEVVAVEPVASNPDPVLNKDAAEDYALARDVLRKLIQKGSDAIDDVHRLADQQESSRGYEVLATMLKTVAETTKDLYDLQKKTKDLTRDDSKPDPRLKGDQAPVNIDKAVFVGSAHELLAEIKKENKTE